VFEGSDACVSPVLSITEAPTHPQIRTLGTLQRINGVTQPAFAPRFRVSLHSHGGPAAAQRELLRLAGGGFWKRVDKVKISRYLEVRQVLARKSSQLVSGGGLARCQHHESVRRLAPLFVREAHHGHLQHRRVPQQGAFNLDGRNVLAA